MNGENACQDAPGDVCTRYIYFLQLKLLISFVKLSMTFVKLLLTLCVCLHLQLSSIWFGTRQDQLFGKNIVKQRIRTDYLLPHCLIVSDLWCSLFSLSQMFDSIVLTSQFPRWVVLLSINQSSSFLFCSFSFSFVQPRKNSWAQWPAPKNDWDG